ncbi:VOC family protein [Mycobacterium sp. JS623]|uniref:VOC family protein n=1 Tax=Mycobacterium sp. JS623 TaxID=212767 RepID=UPI0003188F0F|nr:VOC family protein [Mycobacterium sp. JS623]
MSIRGAPGFRLWRPRLRLGAQLVNAPGSWNFSDLHTGDAPPGFADAIAWVAPLANGQDHWHVRFTVASRDESAASAERHGAVVLSSDDTERTKTALIRDPQGAELTLSQFTPPAN